MLGKRPGLAVCGEPWHNVAGLGGKQNPVRWRTGRQNGEGEGWGVLSRKARMWGEDG